MKWWLCFFTLTLINLVLEWYYLGKGQPYISYIFAVIALVNLFLFSIFAEEEWASLLTLEGEGAK